MVAAERSRGAVERARMAAICEAARGGDGGRGGEGEAGVGAGHRWWREEVPAMD